MRRVAAREREERGEEGATLEEEYDESFTISKVRHMIQATIQTRTLNKDYLTEEKVSELVGRLKSMVDAEETHFDDFTFLAHGETCPDESVDIFELPDSKRFADFQEENYFKNIMDNATGEVPDFMNSEFAAMMNMFGGMAGGDDDEDELAGFEYNDISDLDRLFAAETDDSDDLKHYPLSDDPHTDL